MTVYSPAISTYEPLETIVLDNAASSVTFFNISQDYRDLVVVINGTATGFESIIFQFNGDTTDANYANVLMYGDGASAGSTSGNGGKGGLIQTTLSNSIAQIMDYTATDKHKTFISRGNVAGNQTRATASRWANTSAITSIRFHVGAQSFNAGTTFELFGIAS